MPKKSETDQDESADEAVPTPTQAENDAARLRGLNAPAAGAESDEATAGAAPEAAPQPAPRAATPAPAAGGYKTRGAGQDD